MREHVMWFFQGLFARPLVLLLIFFVVGFSLEKLPLNFSLAVFLLLLSVLLFLFNKYKDKKWFCRCFVKKKRHRELLVIIILMPVFFIAGRIRIGCFINESKTSSDALESLYFRGEKYIVAYGNVEDIYLEEDGSKRIRLSHVEVSAGINEEALPCGDIFLYADAGFNEKAGSRVMAYGKFKYFVHSTNPGEFDLKTYYNAKGIYASLYAVKLSCINNGNNHFVSFVNELRNKMKDSITGLYSKEDAGIVLAMVLGDKANLQEETKDLFRKNGLSHILVISGTHISLICLGFFGILKKRGINKILSGFLTVSFMLFYVYLCGNGISALRAAFMTFSALTAVLIRRNSDMFSGLSFALIVLLMLYPGEFFGSSLLLSSSAVVGIGLLSEIKKEVEMFPETGIGRTLKRGKLLFGSVFINMTMRPVILMFFYEIYTYGIFANLLLLPLCGGLLSLALVSSFVGIFSPLAASFFAAPVYLLIRIYEGVCGFLIKAPFSAFLVGKPGKLAVILYYFFFFLFFFLLKSGIREGRAKIKTLGFFAIAMVIVIIYPRNNHFECDFLDVDQGDCIVITDEKGKVVVIDCGSTGVSGVGKYRLTPFLKSKGKGMIDTLILTHMDSDHINGAIEIIEAMDVYEGEYKRLRNYKGNISVRRLILPLCDDPEKVYEKVLQRAHSKNIEVVFLTKGESLKFNKVSYTCLHPGIISKSENEDSFVFCVNCPQYEIWLMGDADINAEREVLKYIMNEKPDFFSENRKNAKIRVLKAGHHGSKTSSCKEFISFIKPDIVVFSAGFNNSYGHPHKSVLEMFEDYGTKIHRTDKDGGLQLLTN
ncbi:MAG: DNA internalization-related competence protein ComEC/Rec2 [Lachnospiraceae bacterium]|nr:DNA internalization-related competence protein ComEC/Rec2 [Lachnospiraceae bacterium]